MALRQYRHQPKIKRMYKENSGYVMKLCGRSDAVGNKCIRPSEHIGRHLKKAKHKCHWPGCNLEVPPKLWGCKYHWFKLPKNLRDKVWATYRSGQEIDKNPSKAYLIVARRVQTWVKENT